MYGMENKEDTQSVKLDTNPKHAHTCSTTHAVWHVSCGTACKHHDIDCGTCHRTCHVAHLVIQVSHGSGTSDILGMHHPSSIARQRKSKRLQSEIAIWRLRDFKIVKSWDCEIYRLRDLEIATSEIVKSVDCEYCGVWSMRASQNLSSEKNDLFIRFTQSHRDKCHSVFVWISHGPRLIWARTKCRLDLSENLNKVLTEIKSDKRTCKKEWRQNMMSWSQVTHISNKATAVT